MQSGKILQKIIGFEAGSILFDAIIEEMKFPPFVRILQDSSGIPIFFEIEQGAGLVSAPAFFVRGLGIGG
jgi:hypothetical protein